MLINREYILFRAEETLQSIKNAREYYSDIYIDDILKQKKFNLFKFKFEPKFKNKDEVIKYLENNAPWSIALEYKMIKLKYKKQYSEVYHFLKHKDGYPKTEYIDVDRKILKMIHP
jgi:hypothetical protein